MKKRGISPIIATVLLIMIVIIIAIVIFIWYQGFIGEGVYKFDKPIDAACSDVKISGFKDDFTNTFGFTNTGSVPIYAVDLKLKDGADMDVERVSGKVNAGLSKRIEDYDYTLYDEIKVIPILLGKTRSGAVKEFTCPDNIGIQVI
jgi:flagellin-like protein